MVVLPEPDSPTIARDLACGTVKLTPSTATSSPNSLRSPLTSSTGWSPLAARITCGAGIASLIGLSASGGLGQQVPAKLDRTGAPGLPAVQPDQLGNLGPADIARVRAPGPDRAPRAGCFSPRQPGAG